MQPELLAGGVGGGSAAMTFDEKSMERSKGFVKALQELKNLRPQLYSAGEYCEKSYLHSEQKQMVLDNIKDYALRALVNAVDHLGTVASKLSELFEQQDMETSTLEVKVMSMNQKILTYQVYMDQGGIRQQKLFGATPKLHKHYILPNTGSKRMQRCVPPQADSDDGTKPRPYPSAKTLSWHLASETITPDGVIESSTRETKSPKIISEASKLRGKGAASPFSRNHRPTTPNLSAEAIEKDGRQLQAFGSIDTGRLQIQRRPVQPKNMLAAFFVKHKSSKSKRIPVV